MSAATPIDALLARLPDAKPVGEGWTARCPAHDDTRPSLSIHVGDDGRALLHCFAGCTAEAVARAVGLEMRDLFPGESKRPEGEGAPSAGGTRATAQPSGGVTLDEYADAKKLPVEFLTSLGLRTTHGSGADTVAIPYHDQHGAEAAVQIRCALAGDNRFRWRKGTKPTLYGLGRLSEIRERNYVTLVEGASDAQTLWFHGEPALGVPGANLWREERDAPLLDGIETVYVVVEPDRGGEAVLAWIAKSRIRDRVRLVRLVTAKDPSDLYLRDQAGFRAAWARALAAAERWRDAHDVAETKRRDAAWSRCEPLARSPRILDDAVAAVAGLGVVGEDRNVKILYLAITSRLLEKIVSVVVKGPSSAGKSFTVQNVLRLFPASAFHVQTAMSERSLLYSEEPLAHRMLVVYEAAGIHGDFATYLLRSLLSEGRIDYDTVEKTQDGLRPRRIERAGPSGLIVTTTAVSLHAENETRLLSLVATDTPEQTRRVLQAMAAPTRPTVDLAPWHSFQEWLALSERRVEIPFAERIADLMPPVAIRLRRDFAVVLSLIAAHALLHQASRARNAEGSIVATLDDYAVVRELVADLLAEGVGATVSPTIRETVAVVSRLREARPDMDVAVADVARELRIDKSSAWRRVRVAIERGFLSNEEEKKARPARLVLGEPLPEDVSILPAPELLDESGCTVAGGAEPSSSPSGLHPEPQPSPDASRGPTGRDGDRERHDEEGRP